MSADNQGLVTILSIDGGGMKGVIPATILSKLEKELQDIDRDPGARISDYFDVIAGTSTGGLIAAMLTTPKGTGRRPRSAAEIKEFYEKEGPQIFSKKAKVAEQWVEGLGKPEGLWKSLQYYGTKAAAHVLAPQYDSDYLRKRLTELIGKDFKLAHTLNNVVLPTFDMHHRRPIIFSKRKAKNTNIMLADVVKSSSAAPFYFPNHTFEADGKTFHLADGGLAANNPTMLAIREARDIRQDRSLQGYKDYRILSLGTGVWKEKSPYASFGGGLLDMLLSPQMEAAPMIENLFRGMDATTEMYISTALGDYHSFPHYMRIQDYDMKKELNSMTVSTPQQLEALEKCAHSLLDQPLLVMNHDRNEPEPDKRAPPTVDEALKKFAQDLSEEKKRRMTMSSRSSNSKKGK